MLYNLFFIFLFCAGIQKVMIKGFLKKKHKDQSRIEWNLKSEIKTKYEPLYACILGDQIKGSHSNGLQPDSMINF